MQVKRVHHIVCDAEIRDKKYEIRLNANTLFLFLISYILFLYRIQRDAPVANEVVTRGNIP